jgi:hypothetical protein
LETLLEIEATMFNAIFGWLAELAHFRLVDDLCNQFDGYKGIWLRYVCHDFSDANIFYICHCVICKDQNFQ